MRILFFLYEDFENLKEKKIKRQWEKSNMSRRVNRYHAILSSLCCFVISY